MPSGKTHTKINAFIWALSLILFLKFFYILYPIFKIGIWDKYFTGWFLAGVWFCLYSLDFYFHTKYLNPDVDCKSEGRKALGVIGWILDMIFPHRGPTHNIILWGFVFAPLCLIIGTWFIGGYLAICSHVVADKVF